MNRAITLSMMLALTAHAVTSQAAANSTDPLDDVLPAASEPLDAGSAQQASGRKGSAAKQDPTHQAPSVVVDDTASRQAEMMEAWRRNEPLDPAQIRQLQGMRSAVEEARSERPVVAARSLSVPVSLQPGGKLQTLMVSDGYVSAITVTDSTGQPWPLAHAAAGNSAAFKVEIPEHPGNVALVSAKEMYAKSNLILLLEGATTPITLTLDARREMSYYNANLTVDQRGPNALQPTGTRPPPPIDSDRMRSILDGAGAVTPGVKQVDVTGGNAEGYMSEGRLFIRTELAVLSPAFVSSIRSGSMAVYELPITPVIVASDALGEIVELRPTDTVLVDGALANRGAYDPMPKF